MAVFSPRRGEGRRVIRKGFPSLTYIKGGGKKRNGDSHRTGPLGKKTPDFESQVQG